MTCQVVRVGIFFDGTGNNLFNDEAGRSSNGVSNIGKLFRLYRDSEVIDVKSLFMLSMLKVSGQIKEKMIIPVGLRLAH